MAIDHATEWVLRRASPLGELLVIGRPQSIEGCTPPDELFAACGASGVKVLDLTDADINHDLNEPIVVKKRFTTVLDIGTIEHVANVSQCFRTLMELTDIGGQLIIASVTDGNQLHGFWQLSPGLFHQMFTGSNGWALTGLWTYRMGSKRWKPESFEDRQLHRLNIARCIVSWAKRVEDARFSWPIQKLWTADPKPAGRHPFKNALALLKSVVTQNT